MKSIGLLSQDMSGLVSNEIDRDFWLLWNELKKLALGNRVEKFIATNA